MMSIKTWIWVVVLIPRALPSPCIRPWKETSHYSWWRNACTENLPLLVSSLTKASFRDLWAPPVVSIKSTHNTISNVPIHRIEYINIIGISRGVLISFKKRKKFVRSWGNPEKLSKQGREQKKLKCHMPFRPRIEQGPQRCQASALDYIKTGKVRSNDCWSK